VTGDLEIGHEHSALCDRVQEVTSITAGLSDAHDEVMI
jgi:hypothetical protein